MRQFMVPHMVALIVIFALVLALPTPALAAECTEKACINVYTDNNQIIIEARKGNTTAKKSISQAPKKTTVKPSPKPSVRPLFFPPAAVKPTIKKPAIKRTYKPRIKKATTPTNANPGYGFMNYFLNTDQKLYPSAPATAYAHIGNGTNAVYVDEENDLVAVVRWIEDKSMDGFLKILLGALPQKR